MGFFTFACVKEIGSGESLPVPIPTKLGFFFSDGEINDVYVYLISIWSLEFETFKEH